MIIVLEPAGIDASFFAEQYDDLVRDLESEGHTVVLKPRPEKRSGGAVELGGDLIIRLLEHAEDGLIDLIVLAAIARLKGWKIGRKGHARRGVIYGANGETLRKFDLPGEE